MIDDELIKSLKDLAHQEKKLASLKYTFLRGIIYGFGLFIGSILLVALFLWLLSLFDTAPLVGQYVSKIVRVVENGAK